MPKFRVKWTDTATYTEEIEISATEMEGLELDENGLPYNWFDYSTDPMCLGVYDRQVEAVGIDRMDEPESSACHKKAHCVLQVGHEGPCAATFQEASIHVCRLAQLNYTHDPKTCAWCKLLDAKSPAISSILRKWVLEEAARIRKASEDDHEAPGSSPTLFEAE